jgi:hypothetical protein
VCWVGLLADCAGPSSTHGRHICSHESQGLVEVGVRKLPDQVGTTLADRRVDLPHVGIVQLLQLLLVAHVDAFQP